MGITGDLLAAPGSEDPWGLDVAHDAMAHDVLHRQASGGPLQEDRDQGDQGRVPFACHVLDRLRHEASERLRQGADTVGEAEEHDLLLCAPWCDVWAPDGHRARGEPEARVHRRTWLVGRGEGCGLLHVLFPS